MPAEFELLRSLTKDEQTPIETVVNGRIPMWLNGTLFRNGPGRYEYGDKAYIHLFDGHACVHKFKIEDGKVIYSNKFLETESYKKSLKQTRLYPVFGTADVCSNLFDRLKCFFVFPETFDNVNVNIQPFGNKNNNTLSLSILLNIFSMELTI
jgi:beta,beta-carotene 9',10'-dioxygenase